MEIPALFASKRYWSSRVKHKKKFRRARSKDEKLIRFRKNS